jgi:TonB family protein
VIESNNPAFERPALDAVMQWRFSPGLKEGKPVFVRASQRIEFRMDFGGQTSSAWQIFKTKDHASLPAELRWDIAPVPLSTAFPVYPFAMLRAETKGKTLLRFMVGPNGQVVKANVLQATTPEMGLAALAMIDTWHFTPAKKKDGTPMFCVLVLEHNFIPSGFGDVPVTRSAHDILRLLEKHPEKIISANQLDQLPKPISRRPPIYPVTLNSVGQTGAAVIEFFIDEQGDAQLPRIVSSSAPEFGYAAAQAVATWRFDPVKKAGKAVVTQVRIPINFNLDLPKTAAPDEPPSLPQL